MNAKDFDSRSRFEKVAPLFRIAMAMVLLGLLSGCSKDSPATSKTDDVKKKIAVPVTVGTAVEKTVPIQLRAVGNVQAYSTVSIKGQVSGQLMAVHFREGQDVKKGDPLFTIDPRPFEAKLRQAEANLARNKAQLQNARKQVDRYASVVKKGYVAEEQYDQIVASSAALEASVRADEAAVESAKLDLKYCSIHSPINGVAGEIKVHPGNIIKENENDNPMVKVTQVSPIYVGFSVPETSLTELRRHMASRKLEVVATISGNETRPVRGELTFLDNGVDQSTGTILLKGTFANDDKALWPGQFVQVELTLSSQERAVVIPSQALQAGQEGQFLYVVKPDGTAEYRVVLVSRTLENEAVIEQGISPGDRVVTDGQLRLAPGIQVKIVDEGEKTGGPTLDK